jgi:hypothetical protein
MKGRFALKFANRVTSMGRNSQSKDIKTIEEDLLGESTPLEGVNIAD